MTETGTSIVTCIFSVRVGPFGFLLCTMFTCVWNWKNTHDGGLFLFFKIFLTFVFFRSKKEKIAHCHSVVDLVCSPQLRVETFK